jgi:hypothetical protein
MDHCRDWSAADMDRSEIGPYLGGLRSISRVVPQTQPHPGTSPGRATSKGFFHKLSLAWAPPRWGDFSESATSADMDYCRDWSAADMDRSEIGLYLGGLRATFTVVTQGRTAA